MRTRADQKIVSRLLLLCKVSFPGFSCFHCVSIVFPVWLFHSLDAYEICHFRRSSLEICYLLCRLRNRAYIGNGWRMLAQVGQIDMSRHVKTSNRSFCEKTMNQPRKTMEAIEGGQWKPAHASTCQHAHLELILFTWRGVLRILGWRIFCCIFCAEDSLFL